MKKPFSFLKKTSAKRMWPYLIVAAIGIALMCLGGYAGRRGNNGGAEEVEPAELLTLNAQTNGNGDFSGLSPGYENALEKRLGETLSKVQGAGRVQVLLTLNNSGHIELAEDVTYEAVGSAESGGDIKNSPSEKRESKHVLVTGKDGHAAPIVITRTEPEIEGAVIVAEGGGSAEIKASLSRAAAALLNLPAHKIEVFEMSKQ